MNPFDRSEPNPKSKVGDELTVTQSGEKMIFHVNKHPIGLAGAYALSGAVTISVAVLAFVAAPHITDSSGHARAAGFALALFLITALLTAVFSFLVTKVYMGNSWTLTSDSLTQVIQSNLFDRESSQLSLHNLEDITSEQNGFLPHLFNYGLIKAETAGDKSKFVFNYCPNPNFYAQKVLAAREAFLQEYHEAINPPHTPGFRVSTNQDDSSEKHFPEHANFLDPETVPPPEPISSNFRPPDYTQPS